MTHDVRRNDFTSLVDADAPVRRIGTGFEFTEGPIWHPVEHYLLFSDMPGDVRRRWDEAGGVREVMRPSNKCNGMTYDADLNLVVCEHATSSLVRLRPDGRREVLASHFEGQELNSPNDVCVRSDGSIYFTDPWFGRMPGFGVERPRELGWQGVFRVSPSGTLDLVVDKRRFDQPNGLCFSPDETLLYVNDTTRALIRVFDVAPDGSLSHGRLFAQGIRSSREAGVPDGMKCDAKGNVWVTAPGGIRVYSPRGVQLGTVRIPEMPANLHWGGEDWRTLFVCATTSVYAVETKVGANVEPFMRRGGDERPARHGGGRSGDGSSIRRGGPAASSGSAASPGPGASSGGAASSRSGASPGSAAASGSSAPPPSTAATRTSAGVPLATDLTLDPARCALIIQDMQNDVVSEGGAFAESGSAQHAREQNVVENVRRLAETCRARGVMVVHVHFLVEPGAPGLTLNAPLFEGLADANALVRGTWGAAPVAGLEPRPGDLVVTKMRMSAWEGSSLETVLKSAGRDVLIDTGAWTNMSIEHTARTGADKGYFMIVPEDACSTMNADWHAASIGYALQNVSIVTRTDEVIAALGAGALGAVATGGVAAGDAGPAAPPAAAAGSASANLPSAGIPAGSGSAEAANEAIRRRMRERRERAGGG